MNCLANSSYGMTSVNYPDPSVFLALGGKRMLAVHRGPASRTRRGVQGRRQAPPAGRAALDAVSGA